MERAKILVVDDESRMRKLVKDFLKKKDISNRSRQMAMEALDIFLRR